MHFLLGSKVESNWHSRQLPTTKRWETVDGLWVHSPNSCSYRVLNSSNIGVKVRRFFGFVLGGIFFFGLPFFSTSSVFFSTSQLFFSLVRLFVNPMRFGSFSTSFQSFFSKLAQVFFSTLPVFFWASYVLFSTLSPLCPCEDLFCLAASVSLQSLVYGVLLPAPLPLQSLVYCLPPLCPCKVWYSIPGNYIQPSVFNLAQNGFYWPRNIGVQ